MRHLRPTGLARVQVGRVGPVVRPNFRRHCMHGTQQAAGPLMVAARAPVLCMDCRPDCLAIARPQRKGPAMPSSVSVILPAYTAGHRIARASDSALAQTRPVLEIIVVDDGSTDDTADVASGFGPPVRVISKPNGGPASARNLAASLAQGDWLAMLDADDWWFPRKNEIQLAHMAGEDIGLSHCRLDHRTERPPDELTFDDLWERNWISNSSVLLRRSIFDAVGGFAEQ